MNRMKILLRAVLSASWVAWIYAQTGPTAKTAKAIKAVRFGRLWDGKGKVSANAIVIVEGDRIRDVTTDASAIPAGAEMIDLSKYMGLPGLIDVHTHRSEEHTSELQSRSDIVCRLLLEKKKRSPQAQLARHARRSRAPHTRR